MRQTAGNVVNGSVRYVEQNIIDTKNTVQNAYQNAKYVTMLEYKIRETHVESVASHHVKLAA